MVCVYEQVTQRISNVHFTNVTENREMKQKELFGMTGDNRSYILEYFIKNSNKDFMRTIDDVYQKLYASEVNEILGDKKRLKKSEQRNKIFGHIQSLLDEGIL